MVRTLWSYVRRQRFAFGVSVKSCADLFTVYLSLVEARRNAALMAQSSDSSGSSKGATFMNWKTAQVKIPDKPTATSGTPKTKASARAKAGAKTKVDAKTKAETKAKTKPNNASVLVADTDRSATLSLEEFAWCLRRFGAKATQAEVCVGLVKSWRKIVHPDALAVKAQAAQIERRALEGDGAMNPAQRTLALLESKEEREALDRKLERVVGGRLGKREMEQWLQLAVV